jgi:hypothetical protein
MRIRALSRFAAVCAVILAVQGCGGGGGHSPTEQPEPTVDSLTLVRIEPAQGTALRRGSQVTFRSRLAYTTARATQGTIVAIVLGPNGPVPTQSGFPFSFVSGRRGEVEMTFVVTVPANGSNLGLIFDFEPDGGTTADTSVEINYPTQP